MAEATPSIIPWYFETSQSELNSISTGLTEFESQLLSKLVHVLRLALHLTRLLRNETVTPIGKASPAAECCQKFIGKATKDWTATDKLFPLRRTACSLRLMTALIPDKNISAKSILEICVLRIFGLGSEKFIDDIHDQFTRWNLQLSSEFQGVKMVLQDLGKGPLKISRPVMGELQIVRSQIPDMLQKLWVFAQEIVKKDGMSWSFEEIEKKLADAKIPTIPKHGLLLWLIPSDLVEWGICTPPKIETLVAHVRGSVKSKGPKGPSKALSKIVADVVKANIESRGETCNALDADTIGSGVTKVWRLLDNPPKGTWLKDLMKECNDIQGRPFSVVDLEHILCKVARYAPNSKPVKKRKSSKSNEAEEAEEAEEVVGGEDTD